MGIVAPPQRYLNYPVIEEGLTNMSAPHPNNLRDPHTLIVLSGKSDPGGVDIYKINATFLIDIREQSKHETYSTSKSESGR